MGGRRQTGKLLHGAADLAALLRRKPLHELVALNRSFALRRRHVVEPGKLVALALLGLQRQVVEAGLTIQRLLLLRRC